MAKPEDIQKFLVEQKAKAKANEDRRRQAQIDNDIKRQAAVVAEVEAILAMLPPVAKDYAVVSFQPAPALVAVRIPDCYPIVIVPTGEGGERRAIINSPYQQVFAASNEDDIADIIRAAIVDKAQLPGPQGDQK